MQWRHLRQLLTSLILLTVLTGSINGVDISRQAIAKQEVRKIPKHEWNRRCQKIDAWKSEFEVNPDLSLYKVVYSANCDLFSDPLYSRGVPLCVQFHTCVHAAFLFYQDFSTFTPSLDGLELGDGYIRHFNLDAEHSDLAQRSPPSPLRSNSDLWNLRLRDILTIAGLNSDKLLPPQGRHIDWLWDICAYTFTESWYEIVLQNRPSTMVKLFPLAVDSRPCTFEIRLGENQHEHTGSIFGNCDHHTRPQDLIYIAGRKVLDRRPVWLQNIQARQLMENAADT